MNRIILIIGLIISSFAAAYSQNPRFSSGDVKADFEYLYQTLLEAHYNPYAYVSAQELEEKYVELANGISSDSLSLLEVMNTYQKWVSQINNGHTEIDFPVGPYVSHLQNEGTVFPLELAFENDQALVRANYSSDTNLSIGTEVLEINGKSISEVLKELYPQVSAESSYFKNAKIEAFAFPRYYWTVFGETEKFEIRVKKNGKEKLVVVDAVVGGDDFEDKRNEVLDRGNELLFYSHIAHLKIGSFSGDQEAFKSFIDSCFVAINKKGSQELLLDFRNNNGGDNSFSDYLVSYFADQPYSWCSDFSLKTSDVLKEHIRVHYDTTAIIWKEALENPSGSKYSYDFEKQMPKPEEDRFKGEIFLLINRQSHSMSAVAAAQIQDYGWATLVGEETGDYPSLYASQYSFSLPKTGILVKCAKGYITRVNGDTREMGVVPDVYIQDHLLDDTDEILEGVLHIISAKK